MRYAPVLLLLLTGITLADETTERPFGLAKRLVWSSSRLKGSPDPPLPYVVEKVYPDVEWDRPIYLETEPGTQNLMVIEQGGEKDRPSKIYRMEDRDGVASKQLVLSVSERLVYGMTFHPQYAENGWIFLFSNGSTGEKERVNRVTRYTVARDPAFEPQCDPDSKLIIIEWRSMGHDGGDVVFGHDGMLYVTSGDGTSDSDRWLSAQDPTNLLGGVLRIDVDHPDKDRPYSIPPDNPFVDLPKARGELWAIGLRNPWRMSIDSTTGQIWVGNNGQDLWESAHLLQKAANYGWSVYEGSHPFYAHRELGPGTLTAPTFEHHHTESRSLTGGVACDSARLPGLQGAYIYGDHSTGKIWAGRHDGSQVTSHQEIADTPLHIVAFSNTPRGDLLVVDQTAGIHRLQPNPAAEHPEDLPEFPRTLSSTGLFTSVADHHMADGVVPYDVMSPGWTDGADAQRFIALPDDLQMTWTASRSWTFPDRSVVVQTLTMPGNETTPSQRIETRVLLKQQEEWMGYSYRWNEEQTDAELVDATGADISLNNGQIWRIPSRSECMSCHARAVGYVLGLTDVQMNREFEYDGTVDNQLRTLQHIGLLSGSIPEEDRPRLVNPNDATASLQDRVKSYLHTNCSCCHVAAGGGNARMELEFKTALDDMKVVSEFPQHASFGFSQPRIVAPGDPQQSVMLARLSRRGRGQMPPLVTSQVDESAVELFHSWIASLEPERPFVREWALAELTPHLDKLNEGRDLERGKELYRAVGCGQCHRIEEEIAGIGPNLTDIGKTRTPKELLESIVAPSARIDPKYAATILVTVDGLAVQGRIQSEDEEKVVLRGVESFNEPRVILRSEIEERLLSNVSMMPAGILNTLQQDEILDLMAYVLAGRLPGK